MLIRALGTHLSLLINHIQYGSVQMPSEKSSCAAASCQWGGSSGTPHHLRSSYRWWITIGNRNACGPCGSCYHGLLWKWHECEGSPSLPEQTCASCANRDQPRADREACPQTVWAPGSWFGRVHPPSNIRFLNKKEDTARKSKILAFCIV